MKSNWKKMAASLALLVGISGAAFGQDRDGHRDGDNRARIVTQDRDHDRDNRGWNYGRGFDRDDRRPDNYKWYVDRDGDRHDVRNNYRQSYGR